MKQHHCCCCCYCYCLLVFVLGFRVAGGSNRRLLGLTEIGGYEPWTVVTDVNRIDLDVLAVSDQFAFVQNIVDGSFEIAQQLYQEGGHVAPYAQLTIDNNNNGLPRAFPEGTVVTGPNGVQGTILGEPPSGSTTIRVAYKIDDDNNNDYCRVGALPIIQQEEYSQCYAPSGDIVLEKHPDAIPYRYSQQQDNRNRITLSTISLNPDNNLEPFVAYEAYYGTQGYGDAFVLAAMQGTATTNFLRGKVDFTNTRLSSRAIAVKTGVLVLNVWKEVNRRMEMAVSDCRTVGVHDDPGRRNWDMAVAFYTGSLEGRDGQTDQGVLLHHLADVSCVTMQTCGRDSNQQTGKSFVNYEVLRLVRYAQRFFEPRQCNDIMGTQQTIRSILNIPLLQNLLRITYERSSLNNDNDDDLRAEGLAYTAALAPLLFACDENDAATLHTQATTTTPPDYNVVKTLLQKHYTSCFGVTCAQVGGYSNSTTYLDEPCNFDATISLSPTLSPTTQASTQQQAPPTPNTMPKHNSRRAWIVGCVMGGLIFSGFITMILVRRRQDRKKWDAMRFTPDLRAHETIDFT